MALSFFFGIVQLITTHKPESSMTTTANNTGIIIGRFYKVPHGFELPFAGRWLKAIGHNPGVINFRAAGGNFLSMGNDSASLLAKNADDMRVTSPKAFN